jgi:hypothetical protein
MFNTAQFAAPMIQPNAFQQQQTEAQQKLQEAFSPQTLDANSNTAQFHPTAASQFSMPTMPQIQTFDAYPQVQTQISLQGMPPLTVNTSRIDPSQYS